jgi:hypothetical protein
MQRPKNIRQQFDLYYTGLLSDPSRFAILLERNCRRPCLPWHPSAPNGHGYWAIANAQPRITPPAHCR